MVEISIISPIKNEQRVLKELINRVSRVMNSNYGDDWEFILINDASTDNSKEVIESMLKKNRNLVLFNHKKSKGQTGCFKTGFDNAKGNIIITMDGDLQLSPEDIPQFVDKINKGYDVVNAIREHRKHPFWIKVASRIYNLLMLLLFNSPVMDAASNFTAFRSKFVKKLPLRGNDHRYIIPIAMRRGARKIGEIIVEHKGRRHGKSKYKTIPKYIKGFPEMFIAFVRLHSGYYDK
jgi:glycosyltransferase involved in cell wall biosynthesis